MSVLLTSLFVALFVAWCSSGPGAVATRTGRGRAVCVVVVFMVVVPGVFAAESAEVAAFSAAACAMAPAVIIAVGTVLGVKAKRTPRPRTATDIARRKRYSEKKKLRRKHDSNFRQVQNDAQAEWRAARSDEAKDKAKAGDALKHLECTSTLH